jgi:hypothetical protein
MQLWLTNHKRQEALEGSHTKDKLIPRFSHKRQGVVWSFHTSYWFACWVLELHLFWDGGSTWCLIKICSNLGRIYLLEKQLYSKHFNFFPLEYLIHTSALSISYFFLLCVLLNFFGGVIYVLHLDVVFIIF